MKLLLIPLSVICVAATGKGAKKGQKEHREKSIVTLGPRPYQLVDSMDPSFLKTQLGKFRNNVAPHRVPH
jgi:hypothetical protein